MNTPSYQLKDISKLTGVNESVLLHFIEKEWIRPIKITHFDQEDLTRIHLILELERELGVNEEAIPIVLHLVDQLHYLRGRLQYFSKI